LTIHRSFNAVAESFFATLKVELVDRQHYRTRPPRRSASLGSSVAVGARVTDHLPRALGSPVVAERCPIPQPSGRPPLETASAK
jgi:hypothetical protein